MEWHLIYRDEARMKALADNGTLRLDPTGFNIFLEIRKTGEPKAAGGICSSCPPLPPRQRPFQKTAYDEADRKTRVRYLKVSCLLVVFLTATGSGLDHTVYPDLFGKLLVIRLVCIALTLGIFGLCFVPRIERFIRAMGMSWALIAQASICAMIFASEGPRSPYYAGLNLVILGVSIFLPWTFMETMAICLATLALYIAACAAFGLSHESSQVFFSNQSFLFFTCVICATSSYFTARKRFDDFQLSHELDCRNRELLELDRLKGEFFSNISHELRTPLTLIVSPLDQVFRDLNMTPELRELLTPVRQNSLRLLKLINDLLELVRLEDARACITTETLNLSAHLPGLIDSVRHLAMNKGLRIDVEHTDPELRVNADPARLEKIVLNVLMNAIKFTARGGAITARWKKQDGWAVIEIQDTGIGIAPKDLPVIFERFRQADSSSTRRYQGSGIGLALARELVLEHKGQIDVQSELDKGSVFSIRLPLTGSASTENTASTTSLTDDPVADIHRRASRVLVDDSPAAEPLVSGQGETTILIVDDEPDMRRFIAGNLAREYKVVQASDGPSGLEAAQRYKPNVAILDLMLPGMDGLELCSKLRADPDNKELRIVLLTARLDEAAKIGALERGADDFITKPFSSLELKTRVSGLIRASKLEHEIRRQNIELEAALKQLRATESQLIQSEKLNAFGGLAAGLLHEINNPLNYTLMALAIGRESIPPGASTMQDAMNDVEEGMTRIKNIITELRAFASPNALETMETFDLEKPSTWRCVSSRTKPAAFTSNTICRRRSEPRKPRSFKC